MSIVLSTAQRMALPNTSSVSCTYRAATMNASGQPFELDLSALCIAGNGAVLSDSWLIFYGQPISPDSALSHQPKPLDAIGAQSISVQLNDVDLSIQNIILIASVDMEADASATFAQVGNLELRVLDESGNIILSRPFAGTRNKATALALGELYRYRGGWKFRALNEIYEDGLAEAATRYGVDIE